MIQFNLLPDVKLEYMKAERNKRLVITISSAATILSVGIFVVLMLIVLVFQKQYINDLTKDIATYSKDLKATPDLDKILTVQSQLDSLTPLHEKKPDANRIFPFIEQITPADVSIANLVIDFDANTFVITGSAKSLNDVNIFADTLKFTEYKHDSDKGRAFSAVVLANFGRADKGASYTINLTFDPIIFSNTENIQLTVPDKVTTRSETEKPTVLFEPVTNSQED